MKLLLSNSDNNFIEAFSEDEKKVLRKRIVGMILATDMANHASQLNVMQCKVKNKNIKKENNNGHLVLDDSDEKELFASQQQTLDFMIHACDLSTPTRTFDCLRQWTYLLFDEFFAQGDLEAAADMPISFLCDRQTVTVAKEQPGFCNYIVLPIWNIVSIIMPQMEDSTYRATENVVNWQAHEETDEEQRVYLAKPPQKKKSLNMLKAGLNSGIIGEIDIDISAASLSNTGSSNL